MADFIECKFAKSHAVRSLWEKTAALARAEKKRPVLALYTRGRRGPLLHADDAAEVLGGHRAAGPPEDHHPVEPVPAQPPRVPTSLDLGALAPENPAGLAALARADLRGVRPAVPLV